MQFDYSATRHGAQWQQRFFEILPGAISWVTIIGITALSFVKPVLAIVWIIAFDLYWLLRIFYSTFFLLISYLILSRERTTNWMDKIRLLDGSPLRYEDIRHVVILPIARETEEILDPGIRALSLQSLPTEKILVVLAVEQRATPAVHQSAESLVEKYRRYFMDFLVVVHPDGLEGEARVKGANATYAAKVAADYLTQKNIPFENAIASCFDADTVVSRDYFACLTYHFMTCPYRARASFQPIPLYNNNIWEVPGFSRVLEVASSFFMLVELTDSRKLVTFSSHSMSFQALTEVGYWPIDMVSDDSAIFWKSFIHFDGDYRVVPMYVTVSMDIVTGENWWQTIVNVYKQKRRWAWGVENFPIVARAFLRKSAIPWHWRVKYAFKLLEGHVAWATWAFLLTFLGWLPILFASKRFSKDVLYYGTQRTTATIFHLSLLSIIVSICLSLLLLPKRHIRFPWFRRIVFAVEWLFVPLIATFFGALPALDAQTRLMFKKPLTFWVAQKRRRVNKQSA